MASDGSNNTERVVPKLALPAAADDAVQVAGRLRRIEAWADRMAVRGVPQRPLAFSRSLVQRFDIQFAPGSRALAFVRRLLPDALDMQEIEMTVSPYAPPMRQLSGVRQGVPMWSAGAASTPDIRDTPSAAAPRVASAIAPRTAPAPSGPPLPANSAKKDKDAPKEIPKDLMAILNMHRAIGTEEK